MIGAGRDYCVSAVCPGDVRVKRTKPSAIPQWILVHRRELYKTPVESSVKSQREPAKGSVFAKIVGFLRRFFFGWINGRTRHVPRKVWNRYLEQLKNDDSLTVWIRYRDKRPSFTASAFLGGDDEVIMVRSQGRIFQVEREAVAELQLMTRGDFEDVKAGGVLRCVIRAWYSDKGEFGFAYGSDSRETYYFDRSGIRDFSLLQSLRRGELGQEVECKVSKHTTGKKYARVEILRMCGVGMRQAGKDKARVAMLRGDLKLAERLYHEVLIDCNNPEFIPALKDLAELYNRTDSRKALDLLAKYEPLIVNETQEDKISFDNMRFIFYRRANMFAEAREVASRVLQTRENRNYEAYIRDYDSGKFSGVSGPESISAICGEDNFVPCATCYGEHLIQGVRFPDEWDPSTADDDALQERFRTIAKDMSETHNPLHSMWWQFVDDSYASDQARMHLQLCAIAYWECQKNVDEKVLDVKPKHMRTGWRNYFYRQLQCRLFSSEECTFESRFTSLVWTARCAQHVESDRYQKRLPIVMAMLLMEKSSEELKHILEDQDYNDEEAVGKVLAVLGKSEELRHRFEQLATAYGLHSVFVNLDRLYPQHDITVQFDYESLVRRACDFADSDSQEVSMSRVEAAEELIGETMRDVEKDDELRGQIEIILTIAKKYASAISFVEKRNESRNIANIWEDFEARYIDYEPTLYTTDIYYPVLNTLQDEIQADFVKCSMGQVSLSLDHQNGCAYTECNGKITLKLKLSSEHESAPAINSFSAYILKSEIATDAEPDAICNDREIPGGCSYLFEVTMAVSPLAVERGCGDDTLLLKYTTEGGGASEKRFTISYTLSKETYVPLPNPYEKMCGVPVRGEYCIGREDELKRIRETFDGVEGGQCFVLWGQRRSGKSSVWASFEDELKCLRREGGLWYRYTPLDMQRWQGSYVKHFVDALVNNLTKPKCLGRIDVLDRIPEDAYFERVDCLAERLHDTGLMWVIGLDEMTTPYNNWMERGDEAYRREMVDFMRFLKSCLAARLFHLLLIGQDTTPDFIASCKNEFQVTKMLMLSYLQDEDVRKLIDIGFVDKQNGKSHMTSAAFARLNELTNGAPFFINPMCSLLIRQLNAESRSVADVAQVNQALDLMIRTPGSDRLTWVQFEQWTDLKVPGISEKTMKHYYHRIAQRTVDGIWATKEELIDTAEEERIFEIIKGRKILREEGGRYRLWVNLFTEWLLANEENV